MASRSLEASWPREAKGRQALAVAGAAGAGAPIVIRIPDADPI